MPLFGKAKHAGRATSRFTFEFSDLCVESGLPPNMSATGLVVQCSRGPKMASTEAADLTAELTEVGGDVSWGAQKVSFMATLFASKTGKKSGFSDKRYKVAVLAVKPMFGTSKTQLKEIASFELNIADYVATEQPQPLTLQLERRANDGNPVVLHLSMVARPAKPGVGDDDDDDQSI